MWRSAAALAALAVLLGVAMPARAAFDRAGEGPLRIVFAAFDRDPRTGVAGGLQQIYVADGDGRNVQRITPDDGMFYDWPTWAFDGTKIVFTARQGIEPSGEEAVYLMDPDGSHRVKLTDNAWRNAQPKITRDGRWLVFTSSWSESPELALYRMDLRTMEVEDLTARDDGTFYFESDPRVAPNGEIAFAYSGGRDGRLVTIPTQIALVDADGTRFRTVTNDRYYNTDPALSPDGRSVAISSYRGSGVPRHAFPPQRAGDILLSDWHLVVRDLAGGERVLTRGTACIGTTPCAADDGPAWQPLWSPDGRSIGYLGLRGPTQSGIYAIDANGANARVLVEVPGKSINWWDWAPAGKDDGSAALVGSARSKAHLVYGASVFGELAKNAEPPPARLFISGPDRWSSQRIDTGTLDVELARFVPDGRLVVQARTSYDPGTRPPDSPGRRVHFTLDQLDPIAATIRAEAPFRRDVAEEQVFLLDPKTGKQRQVTTAWTEDPQDAIADDDARGNVDPDVSPDGRFLVTSNVSARTGESFILRIDLASGDALNLTNATSGAVPVADANPRFSPDGSQVAFVSVVGGASELHVMDADGEHVRQLTDDGFINTSPAWSPDGKTIVYASYRGAGDAADREDDKAIASSRFPLGDWWLVSLDVANGTQRAILGGHDTVALRPVVSPDGDRIAFIGLSPWGSPDIHVVRADGTDEKRLQATVLSKEFFVDWR